jgi:hypothetical protein
MKSKTSNYEGSGIYCFFPFDKLEPDNKGVFKIGNTTQTFQQRLQQYHTYFVNGVYVLFFITISPKNDIYYPENYKHLLNVIEDHVIKLVKSKGGVIIVDKRRTWKQGQSEWVYSDLETIQKCFKETVEEFKKKLPQLDFIFDSVDLKKTIPVMKRNFTNRNKLPDAIHADYIFNVNKDDNFVEEKKKASISFY